MGICKCKHCGNEFEGKGNNSKYCSIECSFQSKEYIVDPETGCWNWQFGKDGKGYGNFKFNNKVILAHRFSCESANGPAPEGKNHVLHSCDNPACINPVHLRWGDHQENMDDMNKRNRQATGEKHGRAKLKETDVIDIKAKLTNYTRGDYTKLAEEYGVYYNTVRDIHNGINWKHI